MGHVTPLAFREDFDVAELLDDSFSALIRTARLLNYAALALAVLALICLYLKSAARHSEERAYYAGEAGARAEFEASELDARRKRREEED